jgi:hypothetical protein
MGAVLALDREDPSDLVRRAIKAHGGADKLSQYKAVRTKTKGTVAFNGTVVPFTSDAVAQQPDQLRNDLEMTVRVQRVRIVQVLNGDKAWVSALGQTQELQGKLLAELKETLYAAKIESLVPLLDGNQFTLSLIGPKKVFGQEAMGVKVASPGHKDINLYFDKQSGLLIMTQRQSLSGEGKEVNLETVYRDFGDVDGLQVAKKVVLYQDGKEYLDGAVTSIEFLKTKVDESQFARP